MKQLHFLIILISVTAHKNVLCLLALCCHSSLYEHVRSFELENQSPPHACGLINESLFSGWLCNKTRSSWSTSDVASAFMFLFEFSNPIMERTFTSTEVSSLCGFDLNLLSFAVRYHSEMTSDDVCCQGSFPQPDSAWTFLDMQLQNTM